MKKIIYITGITGLVYILSAIIQVYGSVNVIAKYGLIGLGELAILKLYTYNTLPSIFDSGLSDAATYSVSNRLTKRKWESIQNSIIALVPYAIMGGVIAAICLYFLLAIMGHYQIIQNEFIHVLQKQSIFFPLLFMGNIAEGVIRGFNRQLFIRFSEILIVSIVAIAPLIDYFQSAIDLFILIVALSILRSCVLIYSAYQLLFSKKITLSISSVRRFIKLTNFRIKKNFQLKILGLVDNKIPILIISIFWDSSSVGIYDLMTKIPYLLKTFVGYMNQLILPYSARYWVKNSNPKVIPESFKWILIYASPFYILLIIVIPDFIKILFSVNTGDNELYYKILFIIPFCTMNIGFLQQYFYGDREFIKYISKYQLLQIAISYIVFLIFIKISGPFSFIIGSVISWILLGFFYNNYFDNKYSKLYLFSIFTLIFISLIDINLLNIVNIFSEQINIILNLLINLIIIESFIALIIYFKNKI